jgi:TP901 family phage tail tape measure protein
MADIESNINLDINASGALATLRNLQRQISAFQQTMSKTGAVSSAQLGNMQQNLVNSINSTGQFTASVQRVTTTTESFTRALETNKLSMGQYFRFAGSQVVGFRKLFSTEFDTIDKVARERVKTLQTQYIKLGRDASGAMQAISVRPQVLDMDDLATKTAIATQKTQLFNQLMRQGSTDLLNFGKNTQWAGRQLMVGFTIPLGIMGAAAAREFKAIEEQVIRLERVYGDFTTTMADTEQATAQIKSLADEFTKYGVAVSKTIGLAADAAAMGSMGADLVAQVAEATRLAVLGGVQQEQALETTISLTSAFGVAREDLAKKTDFLNAVENQTMTSIEDLTTAIPKAGPVVQQLGGNVEDLTFFLTAMREGGINASESANALKSGLASLINPTAEASEMLNGFGINLQGIVEANKGNVKGIVVDFASALDTLDPLNRAQAIEQLFGKFQFSRLSTLFQNVIKEGSQAQRVLQLTNTSASELAALSERELGKVEASPLFQFEGAIERFRAALAPVGEEFMKAVTPLINFGTDLLNSFNNMSEGGKQFVVILTGAIAGIAPIALMTFGLVANGVANLIKLFMFVKGIFDGTGRSSNLLTDQLQYMNTEQMKAAAIASSLGQVHTNLIQTFNAEAGAVRNLAGAYSAAIATQAGFMGPLVGSTRGGGKAPKKMARGGMVPGSGNGDIVPAMLTPGEFVLRKDVVEKYPGMIAGMMAGTIQGFDGGGIVGNVPMVGMHAAGKMDMSMQANIDQANRLFPGMVSTLERFPELQEAIIFLTDLTADKARALNNSAKGKGLEAEDFDRQWNETGNTGFVATAQRGSDAMGQGNLSDAEIEELVGIDKNIGQRVTDRIRQTTAEQKLHDGWLDDIIAEETGKIIDEGLQSTDPVKKSVAAKLDNRRKTMVETRSSHWGDMIDPRTGKKFGNADSALRYYESQGALTQTSTGEQMTLAGSSTSIARPARGKWRSDSTVASVGQISGRHYATKGARDARNSPEFVAFAKKWSEDALDEVGEQLSNQAQVRSPSVKIEKATKGMVDGAVLAITEGRDDVVAAQRATTQAQAEAVRNNNPAFGRVADGVTPPTVMSPARVQHFQGNAPKIVGKVPDLATAQAAAYGGMNIMRGQELQFARGAKLLDSAQAIKPMVLLSAAMKSTGAAVKTASVGVKDFGVRVAATAKTIVTSIPGALNKLATSVKQTTTSILASAKSMWSGQVDAQGNVIRKGIGGKVAGAGMAASMGLMMASGAEGPLGDVASKVSGPLMAVSSLGTMLTMIPGPAGIAVAALSAVGLGLFALDQHARQMNESAIKMAKSLSSGKEAMDKIAQATGKINPVDQIAQIRAEEKAGRKLDTGEETFGSQYLASEFGQEFLKETQSALTKLDGSEVASKVAVQMATAVSGGMMSAEQARSVVDNLSVQLKDSEFSANIDMNLLQLIGPDGKNVLENPLALEIKLIEINAEEVQDAINGLSTASAPPWWFGTTDDQMNQRAMSEAEVAQSIRDQVDAEKQALATAELRHRAKIEELKAANDLAGIEEENIKYAKELESIQTNSAKAMKAIQDELSQKAREAPESVAATIDKLQKITTDALADLSAEEKKIADKTVEGIADSRFLGSGEKAVLMASVDIENIDTFNELATMFNPKDVSGSKVYKYIANVSTQLGTESAGTVAEVLSSFGEGNEAKVMEFIANVDVNTDEGMQIIDTLQTMKDVLGEDFNIDLYVNADGSPTEELEQVSSAYADIKEKIAAGGPIELAAITDIDWSGVKDMGALQSWFDSIPKEQQKFFLEHFISVYANITDEEIDSYMRKAGVKAATPGKKETRYSDARESLISTQGPGKYSEAQRTEYKAAAAASQVQKLTQEMQKLGLFDSSVTPGGPSAPPPPTGGGGGGGAANEQAAKAPASFLDDIVKKIRQVTTGAVNLTDEFASSYATINGLFGSGSPTNVFAGLEQQMRKLGASEDIISLITGMPAEEWEQRKNDLFNFDAAGNISGFKGMLNSISRALTAVKLGEFQSKQQQTLRTTLDQANAINKIVAAGASYAQAYEMVQDAATAAAIAQETNIEKIKEIIRVAQEAATALSLMGAAQSVVQSNQETVDMNATINFLTRYSDALSDAQTDAILKSKELQVMLKNFDTLNVDQLKNLSEALRNADLQAELDRKVKMLTPEGMQSVFQEGFSKAMEVFSTKEQEIKIRFQLLRNPFEEVVEKFQNIISDIKNKPGGLDDLEADVQRISEQEIDVNKKYEERLKALDQIQKANERIAAQQRTQLSLAEALSSGDIAAAARAAQEMRAQDAAQALLDQREALQKSQDLEIENLRGEMGMSRKQLEEAIRKIKVEIFEIEEKEIETAQYQLELLKRQEEAEVSALTVLGKTKTEWEQIKNNTDLARVANDQYAEEMNRTLGVAEDLIAKWAEITAPKETLHTIIEKKVSSIEEADRLRREQEERDRLAREAQQRAQASTAAPPAAPSGPTKDDAWVTSMARRVIRGEFGNGQARRNALGGDYQLIQDRVNRILYKGYAAGGLVNYLAKGGKVMGRQKIGEIHIPRKYAGGFTRYANGGTVAGPFRKMGTDTVPAMLTPGEFVVKKYAVEKFGVDNLKAINDGTYKNGSVYNSTYSINVNAKTNANADDIARTVIDQIKRVDAQRIRGNRF